MTANGFQLRFLGPAGSNFVIQASSDLSSWVSISTNPAPTGTVTYVDGSAKTNTIRFTSRSCFRMGAGGRTRTHQGRLAIEKSVTCAQCSACSDPW